MSVFDVYLAANPAGLQIDRQLKTISLLGYGFATGIGEGPSVERGVPELDLTVLEAKCCNVTGLLTRFSML